MPKFTMDDVDKDIEERRAKYRMPKPTAVDGAASFQKVLDAARLKSERPEPDEKE